MSSDDTLERVAKTPGAAVEELHRQLFGVEDRHVYAIVDGASVDGLLPKLRELGPEHCCLFSGELAPDLAEAAPYLIRLAPDGAFTTFVLEAPNAATVAPSV